MSERRTVTKTTPSSMELNKQSETRRITQNERRRSSSKVVGRHTVLSATDRLMIRRPRAVANDNEEGI
jgi:hypothetical protein